MSFESGVDASVTLEGTSYAFTGWTYSVDGGTKKFFAFGSEYQRTLAGAKAATVNLTGYYNAGSMPLTIGTVYTIVLKSATATTVATVEGRLSTVEFNATIEPGGAPAGCVCTFDSEGATTITFT